MKSWINSWNSNTSKSSVFIQAYFDVIPGSPINVTDVPMSQLIDLDQEIPLYPLQGNNAE